MTRADVIAFGDGENDTGMLGWAGVSCRRPAAAPAVMSVLVCW